MTADHLYPGLFIGLVALVLLWLAAQWRVRRHAARYQAELAVHQAALQTQERVEVARRAELKAGEQLAVATAQGARLDVLLADQRPSPRPRRQEVAA